MPKKEGTSKPSLWGYVYQRDKHGNLTPLAMALLALSEHGCDCGLDDDGPLCLACTCEAALVSLLPKED